MENRRRPGRGEPPPPPPSPLPSPSLLRDVSNFKTPRPQAPPLRNPPSPCPLFFTASKKTPSSARPSPAASAFRRRSSLAPPSHSKAARRLRALELEQSRSARRAHVRREKALRSFSRSLSAWLNFLFRDPGSCGCNVDAPLWNRAAGGGSGCGKRSSLEGGGNLGVEGAWRWPKRQRGGSCQNAEAMVAPSTSTSSFSSLQVSLKDICSIEDLKERMSAHLSERSCQEVLSIMSQVTKNIDAGRLKMKSHCPLVTDVGLREKATKVLMCYNPTWLRIGLHIIFGGDLLLQSEEGTSASEDQFAKMVIERQFFSHAGLAKSYAYNKLVEGVYKPGYFEALGSIILKRFILLVLLLDKAKGESTLPVKYGIDGVDGGSPLLFGLQSHIKSSQQVIHGKNSSYITVGPRLYLAPMSHPFYVKGRFQISFNQLIFLTVEFLSEVMHGEGDLLAHLVILGCKVSHQQLPLAEYNFYVTNLFEDLQDGVLLCRTIQLLKSDASVLSKLMIPSNTQKKNIQNCNVALQYLKLAGVPLSDEDGVLVVAEDVASGDRELILSLLWNIFVHLQALHGLEIGDC
ncbi:hypothetical protein Taro_050718 [Colocasia esculenta]|uniref:Calponin-homology (CH) domain-containing protein n=1 Tax=Colocasia esculenta TaxID=4460 RepID=A0A843XEP8_COLES|nr:hypothetical protein [Colocasia esculenta]